MDTPLSITSLNEPLPSTLQKLIREKAASLEDLFDPIIHCRVAVEGPGRHHRNGGLYDVRIVLRVPGDELVVNRQDSEDLRAGIREAFDAARRQLEDYARRRRGAVKTQGAE